MRWRLDRIAEDLAAVVASAAKIEPAVVPELQRIAAELAAIKNRLLATHTALAALLADDLAAEIAVRRLAADSGPGEEVGEERGREAVRRARRRGKPLG